MTNYKLIAVGMSSDCVQFPKCSFCYQKRVKDDPFDVSYKLDTLVTNNKTKPTICYEFNGYNLSIILDDWHSFGGITKTMTTMPSAINKILCNVLKNKDINTIALSFDSQKCSRTDWIFAAAKIIESGITLNCNYLIERYDFEIPQVICELSKQINILIKKPFRFPSKKEKELLKQKIEIYKSNNTIALDSCLGVLLGFIKKCAPGKDFVHINPDGTVSGCCFDSMCHFINKKGETK